MASVLIVLAASVVAAGAARLVLSVGFWLIGKRGGVDDE